MKFYYKKKFNIDGFYAKRYYLFGHCFFQRNKIFDVNNEKILKKFNVWFPNENLQKYYEVNKNIPPFYLKVNRMDDYVFITLQRWVDIAYELGADFYIVCDKKELEYQILQKVRFANPNIKFIKSNYSSLHKIVSEVISSPRWFNAGLSHLTTFWHSRQHNIANFWNIDADDTMFLSNTKNVAQMLKKAQEYADKNNINVFSLDMWYSSTNSFNWSFGISYIKQNVDYFHLIKNVKNKKWIKGYQHIDESWACIDYFFKYLKDCELLNLGTFYFDNVYFFHLASFNLCHRSFLCQWKNGELISPIEVFIFKLKEAGKVPIAKDCVNIKLDKTEKELIDYDFLRYGNVSFFDGWQEKYNWEKLQKF